MISPSKTDADALSNLPRTEQRGSGSAFATPGFAMTPALRVGSQPASIAIISGEHGSWWVQRLLLSLGARVSPVPANLPLAELARSDAPDLIVVDLGAASANAPSVVRTLRKNPNTYAIPVVVVTGPEELGVRVESLEEGASDCVIRHSTLAEVGARIGAVLRVKGREDLLRRRVRFLEDLAASDPLTSLMNRRAFIDRLHLEMDRSVRNGHALSCLVLDIDWFKGVNDRYGHQVGDDVLRHVAKVLVHGCRESDTACRYGGEEFVWLLPGIDRDALLERAEWLRRTIQETEIPTMDASFHVTVSIGASVYRLRDHGRATADLLLALADGALLDAKQQGKNRVVFREPTLPETSGSDGQGPEPIEGTVVGPWTSRLSNPAPDWPGDHEGADRRLVPDYVKVHEEMRTLLHSSVKVLTAALGARDTETMAHCHRVASTAVAIAMELKLSDEEVERIELASLLHDIGKLAVPEAILNKPGALTPGEWQIMRKHAEHGADMLRGAKPFNHLVDLVLHHQESFDGTGYPDGLSGDNIPLGARIIRIADIFDALLSDRPYRPRKTLEEAKFELRKMSGTTVDPKILNALLRLLNTMTPLEVQLGLRGERELLPLPNPIDGQEP